MDRENFWLRFREAVDHMLDTHIKLTDENGQDSADQDFERGMWLSNRCVQATDDMPFQDALNVILQHAAFACAACYLDLQGNDIVSIERLDGFGNKAMPWDFQQ